MIQHERHASHYILGHSLAEHDRLREQAERLARLTRRLLTEAGLAPGMHVLDLGCGLGDVSLLAAELVGPTGLVIGIDRSPEVLALARDRAANAGQAQLRFVASDVETLAALPAEVRVDAVIGRCILGHLDNPVAAVQAAADRLRPGGLVAFQEPDVCLTELTVGRAALPLLQRVVTWMERGHAVAGRRLPRAGLTLHQTFRQAGLPHPQVESVTQIDCGATAWLPGYLTQLLRSLLPLYERLGVLTAAEADVETLEARLRSEIATSDPEAVLAMWSFVGAWVRRPVAAPDA